MHKLRFDLLLPSEDYSANGRYPLQGKFIPERRYNIDQVTLPFVISQDETFTIDDDNDLSESGNSQSIKCSMLESKTKPMISVT